MTQSLTTPPARPSQDVSPLRLAALGVLSLLIVVIIGAVIFQAVRGAAGTGAASLQALADGQAVGAAGARVTVAEYADFQCPFCRQFHATTESQLLQEYVRTGKVRFEYHHFVIIDSNTGGHESERAAEASDCASAQGKFWPYHDTLYAHQAAEGSGAFNDDKLAGFAQAVGLDMTAFNQCLASGKYIAAIQADMKQGIALGVHGTPTVFVNGAQVPDPMNYNAFKSQLEAALAKTS